MNNGPSIIERQALGNLLEALKKNGNGNQNFSNYMTSWFSDWNPISNSDISLQQYYKTLKKFPTNAKREIIRGVLLSWNKHHNFQILYHSINTLIYLKVCDTVEYFFIQQFYNFLSSFSKVCNNSEFITIEARNASFYTIRFYEDRLNSKGIVDFQLAPIGRGEVFCIVPWNSLLSSKTGIEEDEVLEEGTWNEIVSTEIYPLLKNEFAKQHCNWINSNWDFEVKKEQLGRGLVITMHSLYYEDLNGGF